MVHTVKHCIGWYYHILRDVLALVLCLRAFYIMMMTESYFCLCTTQHGWGLRKVWVEKVVRSYSLPPLGKMK